MENAPRSRPVRGAAKPFKNEQSLQVVPYVAKESENAEPTEDFFVGQSPGWCQLCEKDYTNQKNLYSHVRLTHTITEFVQLKERCIPGQRDVRCERCLGYYKSLRLHHKPHCDQLIEQRKRALLENPSYASKNTEKTIHTLEVLSDSSPEKSIATLECPFSTLKSPCRKLRSIPGLYVHIRERHGTENYVQFRTKRIEGIHTEKCDKCTFYFTRSCQVTTSAHKCAEHRKMASLAGFSTDTPPKNLDAKVKCPHCKATLVYEDDTENTDHMKFHGVAAQQLYKGRF